MIKSQLIRDSITALIICLLASLILPDLYFPGWIWCGAAFVGCLIHLATSLRKNEVDNLQSRK